MPPPDSRSLELPLVLTMNSTLEKGSIFLLSLTKRPFKSYDPPSIPRPIYMPWRPILFIIFLFIPLFGQSQTAEHSFFLAPGLSYYSTSDEAAYPYRRERNFEYQGGAGIGGYELEYHISSTLAFGSSIKYGIRRGKLYTSCFCFHIPEQRLSVRNLLTLHSLDVPLVLKLKDGSEDRNKATYFQAGLGLSHIFATHKKVEHEAFPMGNSDKVARGELEEGYFSLRTKGGSPVVPFFQVGIGKRFPIGGRAFFVELVFDRDLRSLQYEAKGAFLKNKREVSLKRNLLTLQLGYILPTDKAE